MRQADIFLGSEGDEWLRRNRDRLGERDPVSEMIAQLDLQPKRVLEVGCSNGWRLAKLRAQYGCEIMGVDPSLQAGLEAAAMRVPVIQATASGLPVSGQYDLIIYAFCLYLTDPQDWLRIAANGDMALAEGGHLIIHDFKVDQEEMAFARHYHHRQGVMAFHYDFANLWLGSSLYRWARRREYVDEMVTALRKDVKMMVRP